MEKVTLTKEKIRLKCVIEHAQIRTLSGKAMLVHEGEIIEVPEESGLEIINNTKVARYGFEIVPEVKAEKAPKLGTVPSEEELKALADAAAEKEAGKKK